jgi:hypothetical protein
LAQRRPYFGDTASAARNFENAGDLLASIWQ